MTRLVVADTGPINYLLLAGAIEAVPKLFEQVIVPGAVLAELRATGAPDSVRAWASQPPPWLGVQFSTPITWRMPLERGEAEAIRLALDLNASLILIDDLAGREAATEFGLSVIGTVGLIRIAAQQGLIDLGSTLARLEKTNIHLSANLLNRARKIR